MLLTEIDHVAIAVNDLEAAIDYYRQAFGATVTHREVVETDGVEEALLAVGHSYIQLTRAHPRGLPDRQVHRQARRGPPPRRLPRRRLRRGAGGDDRRRGHRHRRRPPPGQPRHDRGLRPPQGQLRHADRARPGVSTPTVAPAAAPPAAVLWDMDGTLVDTEPYWMECEHELVAAFGGTWTDDDARSIIGFDLLDAAAVLRERGGVALEPTEIVERLLDGVIARVRRRVPVAARRPAAAVRAQRQRRAVRARHDVVEPAGRRRGRGARPDHVPGGHHRRRRASTASRTPSRTCWPRARSASTRCSAWPSRTPRPASSRRRPPGASSSPSRTSSPSRRRPGGSSCRSLKDLSTDDLGAFVAATPPPDAAALRTGRRVARRRRRGAIIGGVCRRRRGGGDRRRRHRRRRRCPAPPAGRPQRPRLGAVLGARRRPARAGGARRHAARAVAVLVPGHRRRDDRGRAEHARPTTPSSSSTWPATATCRSWRRSSTAPTPA